MLCPAAIVGSVPKEASDEKYSRDGGYHGAP